MTSDSIRLTPQLLDQLIHEVILEDQASRTCAHHKTTAERKDCENRFISSTEKSTEKRKRKEELWPGYYDRNGSLYRIQRGILETSEGHTTRRTLSVKFRSFSDGLTADERKLFSSLIAKPTMNQLLKFCGDAKDKLSGDYNDEQLQLQKFMHSKSK